ncbi:MAG: Ig-like domain-containing protein [Spirochaetaceae bacterium]
MKYLKIIAIALTFLTFSCDNFMSNGDDFIDAVETEVDEATAPTISVNIRADEDKMGITSPLGAYSTKVGVPFDITTTVSLDYAFLNWSFTGGEDGDVTFDDSLSTVTMATVNENKTGLTIVPIFDKRPSVSSWVPFSGSSNTLINKSITVTFDELVDESTVSLGEGEAIEITTKKTSSTDEPTHVETRFNYNITNKTLIISLKADNYHDKFSTITVLLSSTIADLNGNAMTSDFPWFFETGNGKDEDPPWISSFIINNIEISPAYSQNLGLEIEVSDNSGPTEINRMQVIATPWTADNSGGSLDGVGRTVFDSGIIDYDTEYNFSTTSLNQISDGWVKVRINVADKSNNWSTDDVEDIIPDASDSSLNTKYVYLDNTVPTITEFILGSGNSHSNADPVALTITASDAGSGLDTDAYAITTSSTTPSTWTVKPTEVALTSGVNTLFLHVKDKAGNTTYSSETVILDQITPKYTLTEIEDGSATDGIVRNSNSVILTATFDEDIVGTPTISIDGTGVTAVSSVMSGSDRTWSYTWTPQGDGTAAISISAQDLAENDTEWDSGRNSYTVDNTIPTITDFSILSDSDSTNDSITTLTITGLSGTGSDIYRYSISNSLVNSWQIGSTPSTSWDLGSGDGTKTVYFRVEDAAGNPADWSDTIDLDTAEPTISALSSSNVAGTTAKIKGTSNEDGTLYYIITESSSSPSAASIKNANSGIHGYSSVTAATEEEFDITGLDETTTYYFHMTAVDGSGNTSSVYTSASFTTLDETPPTLSGLASSDVTGTTAKIKGQSNENGTLYYIVNESSSSPTATAIKSASSGIFGNDSVTANTDKVFDISGLDDDTTYYFHMTAVDGSGNTSSVYSSASFTTLDETPPILSGVTSSNIAGVTAKIKGTSDEAGIIYYIITTSSSTPTATAIRDASSGIYANSSVTADTEKVFNITGLLETTQYFFYMTAADSAGNLSDVSNELNFTTLDVTAPTLSAVTSSDVAGVTAKIKGTSDESGTIYYIITTSSSSPTATAIRDASSGIYANSSVTADTEKVFDITGLLETTQYFFYMTAADSAGNLSDVSNELNFTTLDVTAPTLSAVTSSDVAGVTAKIKGTSDEVGTIYYIITTSSSSPTATDIRDASSGIYANGSVTADTEEVFDITGLLETTQYFFYMTAADSAGNLSDVSAELNFTTLDVTAPTLSGVTSSDVAGVTAKIKGISDEVGTIYYIITTSSSSPTATDIRDASSGIYANSSVTTDTEEVFDITGLLETTQYFFYMTAADSAGNLSDVSAELNFTTLDVTAPILSGETASNFTKTSARIKGTSDEDGTIYCIITASSSTPTNTDIRDASLGIFDGSDSVTADSEGRIDITGLTEATTYYYYMTAEDSSGNLSDVSTESSFTTDP